jgi:hypothetical protein
MDHQPPVDSSIMHAPTLPRRSMPVDAGVGRFSPLTAPEREVVDSFCRDSRPWALRQARRSYRHLPESLREQAVERAFTELRTRAPGSLERRALAAELADRLTESLRHVHVGWCLNESSALLRREGTEPVQPEVRREELAHFVDGGLGGLERAVLQLEIGAGRDTRTSRAALRLNPRQYTQHREAGLSKLRDAISAQVLGRACDQHVGSVVDAALGDRKAMASLSGGTSRCRYCAREAQGLRSVLHERLAVAPWPIAVKPAGLLAAKLGALGAVFGGKGAGAGAGTLAASSGSGASVAATVLATAALATGTAAVIGKEGTPPERTSGNAAAETRTLAKPAAGTGTRTVAGGTKATKRASRSARKASRSGTRRERAAARKQAGSGAATTTAATTAPSTAAPATSTGGSDTSSGPVSTAAKPVTDAVEQTASKVTSTLPPAAAKPVQDTVTDVTGTVDDATKVVDSIVP